MSLVDLKWQLRFLLGEHPNIFYPLYKCYYQLHQDSQQKNDIFTQAKTQIVIEGYPRSANTSTVAHFQTFNPEINIAHHHHVPAQIIQGVKQEIPVIVLIRNPVEAISSFKCLEAQLSLIVALKNYISFYNKILPYYSGFMVVSFERLFAEFNYIIREVNNRFKIDFREGIPMIQYYLTKPSKEKYIGELRQEKYSFLMRDALNLYQFYLTIEDAQRGVKNNFSSNFTGTTAIYSENP